MIITRTPYRLSFFGGGTDYNSWFEKNEGLIIGSSFQKYCWITIRKLPPFFNHNTRFCYSQTEEVTDNFELKHPGARSCLKFLNIKDGLEIHHDGDLPARSGIGSSSSFTAGFLLALHAHQNKVISKRQLAEQAIYVEQKIEKQNVGIQDQIFASFGGMQVISMGPSNTFSVSPLVLPPEYKKEFSSHILLAFSGFTRYASDSAKKQIDLIQQGKVDNQLKEIHSIAKEALSLFAKNEDFKEYGRLFDQSWKLKRSLTDSISNTEIDDIYEIAIKNGAYGGRLIGAGEGGFLMFFAPPERHSQIKTALNQIKVWVPFEVDNDGAKIILYHD